jgi:septum site-determining protein MinC
MTSDSAIPYLKSNSTLPDAECISHLSDVEVDSTVFDADPIIPDAELKSVIRYLKANSISDDAESNSVNPDIDAIADTEPNPGIWDFNSATSVIIENRGKNNIQVQFKTEAGRLLVVLPTELQVPASEVTWSDIWQQLKLRLKAGDRLRTPNTTVHLIAQDRLLDSRQLQELAEAFSEVQLQLKCVATSRRQTAIAAVTSGYSVEQLQPETSLSSQLQAVPQPQADTLYLVTTVRSGTEIRHAGTVILLGDLNPGGIVVAEGDILVWGRLRGIAHAGAGGNRECLIMALQMEPTQLRIADAVARAPEKSPLQLSPEVAHITPQGIRIARAADFSRSQLTRINQAL